MAVSNRLTMSTPATERKAAKPRLPPTLGKIAEAFTRRAVKVATASSGCSTPRSRCGDDMPRKQPA